MTDVSIIGLGAMGSALARALLQAGFKTTVWNRSSARMQPLLALGASGAASVRDAVRASPVIIVCIDNYRTTAQLLETDDVAPHLRGRTLVQLSTGTPREARAAEAWMQKNGGLYIDGALLCSPVHIGTERAIIPLAGSDAAFASCRALMKPLGGDVRYLGDNVGAPSALDLAWLSERFGMYVGAAQGASLCEAEGVDVALYASLFANGEPVRLFLETIRTNAYENPGATVQVWSEGLERIRSGANDTGIDSEFLDLTMALLRRVIAAGHGEEHIAALFKVLRKNAPA
ncbi:MAG: NAD(P)-binding domain-containing protein [Rhodospirillaceae bacterium]|nr:NAD(P)-binding domain-containing protein [Rhodospirillaceae bacterium]